MKTKRTKRPSPPPTPRGQALAVALARLREGEVVSYGDIALRAGQPGSPRAVGAFLSKLALDLPWWRVVYADGRLPPCDPVLQTQCLEEEGVTVRGGRVVRAPRGRFAKGRPGKQSNGRSSRLNPKVAEKWT